MPVRLFVAGVGLIGAELLAQIEACREMWRRDRGIALRVCGLANSRLMAFDEKGIDLDRWRDALDQGAPASLQAFADAMTGQGDQPAIFADCTASEEITAMYPTALRAGVSITAANKKANAGPMARYRELRRLAREHGARFFYETNVGAGLPILGALESLMASGDRMLRVEAVLSGTLSYLFNGFDGSRPFSESVRQAQQVGFTEPDPRDDLNGMDVARKLLIIARESGRALEPEDVRVESLITPACERAPALDDFYRLLALQDDAIERRRREAASAGRALRYLAVLDERGARVSLEETGPDHPCFSLRGCENLASVTTERYRETPLVIKGPGAGAAVTAAGVLADIGRAAACAPRRS